VELQHKASGHLETVCSTHPSGKGLDRTAANTAKSKSVGGSELHGYYNRYASNDVVYVALSFWVEAKCAGADRKQNLFLPPCHNRSNPDCDVGAYLFLSVVNY